MNALRSDDLLPAIQLGPRAADLPYSAVFELMIVSTKLEETARVTVL